MAPALVHQPPDRKLRWVSSVDPRNASDVLNFEAKMEKFYSRSSFYYQCIDFTASAWLENSIYLDIRRILRNQTGPLLELGCGRANLLEAERGIQAGYTGCDFSAEQLSENQARFPRARFQPIQAGQNLPFADASFAAVFSLYVIEHVCRPAKFLDECARILRPGGIFILHCPHFLARGCMPSQRAGLSHGTGREKLLRGRVLDAWLTLLDRKFRIPHRCRDLQRQSSRMPGFWINLAPVCFEDPFEPDHDAVYLTFEEEIRRHLATWFKWESCSPELEDPGRIYLVGIRNPSSWRSGTWPNLFPAP